MNSLELDSRLWERGTPLLPRVIVGEIGSAASGLDFGEY